MSPTKRKVIKHILSGSFGIVLLLPNAAIVLAQENDNNVEDKTPTEIESKSQREKLEKGKGEKPEKPEKPSKNFIPSEEISKDLAVSFPVDI